MTEPDHETNDADRAEQSMLAGDVNDDERAGDFPLSAEADAADQVEQHQDVPPAEDEYDR